MHTRFVESSYKGNSSYYLHSLDNTELGLDLALIKSHLACEVPSKFVDNENKKEKTN